MLQAEPRPKAEILAVLRSSHHVELKTAAASIRIEPISESVIRISTMEGAEWGRPALETVPRSGPVPDWTLEDGQTIVVATSQVQVRVKRDTGVLQFFDARGKLLLSEQAREGRLLERFESMRTVFEESKVTKIVTPDGTKDQITEPKRVFRKHLFRARFSWQWSPGEALYGLGQNDTGAVNLRGTRQYVHQANMKIAMPLLVSTNGYGLLFDTAAPLIFNDNEHGSYVYLEAVEQPAYYFIQGDDLDAVIAGYRQVTGTASLLPRWCFGYVQSQERYESQQELLDIVKEHRRRGLPLDVIVLDWLSWTEGLWGQKSFDPTRFPSPRALTDELHALGVKMMISVWPTMDPKTADHLEMKAKGHLFPLSEIYDAFSEPARKTYWDQANRGLFSHGIDAWWCDSSEPFSPEWNLVVRPEPDRNYREFHETARMWIAEEQTNAYALWHAQGIDQGQRAQTSQKRVVNLTRSAWAGQQRYGTIMWSGDTSATWDALRKQVPGGLGLVASGLPYWTMDIGAFFVKRGTFWFWDGLYEEGNRDPAYRELYLRWFQLGAFLPMFRAHGTDTRREIWCFGEPGEPVYDSLAKFLRLRYSLVPFLYSLAGMATQRGQSLMRPMAFDFPRDVRVHDIKDQFLLGKAFLVCPVTDPLELNHGKRRVYLPEGCVWWDFWTQARLAGGQVIEASAVLETMPLFVRAGSIIPLSAPVQSTAEIQDDKMDLSVYPGADGSFTLYQDEGDNLGCEAGLWSTVEISWDDRRSTISLGARTGSWPGMPAKIEFSIRVVGKEARRLVYDGQESSLKL